MTTVSRTNQVTHSSVTGGGDWDRRLNNLLEDLQETVVPPESRTAGTEYREYRMTSSTRTDDEPPISTEEKWVEYGTRGGLTGSHPSYNSHKEIQGFNLGPTTSSTSSYGRTYKDKAIGFSGPNGSVEKTYGVDPGLKHHPDYSSTGRTQQSSRIEYLTPVNTTTVVKSGPSSPNPPITTTTLLPTSSPKVERKEFYAKASYTTLIKSGSDGQIMPLDKDLDKRNDDFPSIRDGPFHQQTSRPPGHSSTTSMESRREYKSSTDTRQSPGPGYRLIEPLEPPMFSSTPVGNSSSYSTSRVTTDHQHRSVTPPPRQGEGLKTPPLIRKVMQQSQSTYSKEVNSNTGRPPLSGTPAPITYEHDIPTPKPHPPTQYYTSTTTHTETRGRDVSPARRFPSPQPPKSTYGEPPKRLDELLATFDESYTETSKISGDGGGPWKSHPYGPGSQPIRAVRIDDTLQSRNVSTNEADGLIQRSGKQPVTTVAETRSVSGPPVFYPPGQIFSKTEEEALMASQDRGKGKAKMKMDRKYKAGEKSKSSHSESGGQGAVPVPVCLPICCAAPCSIV